MKTTYSYDDVLIEPQYSSIRSRSNIDITSNLGHGLSLGLPIIASPMDTVSETTMATATNSYGACAVIHRYNTIEDQVRMVKDARAYADSVTAGGAIGVSDDMETRACALHDAGATFLCVDVAHGHHVLMREALQTLRGIFGRNYHIMAGNVATLEGINDLADWGASSVRVGVGGGSICSTRVQTGHGVPTLQSIMDCSKTDRDVAIIADGGIKNSGDIVKALAAGADAVICGSLFAGTVETPGDMFKDPDGFTWKSYRGMASKEAQIDWRGMYSSFEGVATRVPTKGSVCNILLDLEKGIRSGLSYTGARSIKEFQAKANFIMQTTSGLSESRAHIKIRDW